MDDCGADGYVSSIYTIAVGAIGVNGNHSEGDEPCSSKIVVAYTDDDEGNSAIVSVIIVIIVYKLTGNLFRQPQTWMINAWKLLGGQVQQLPWCQELLL